MLRAARALLFGTRKSGVINIVTRSPQTRAAAGEVRIRASLPSAAPRVTHGSRRFSAAAGATWACWPPSTAMRPRLPTVSQSRYEKCHGRNALTVTLPSGKAVQSFGDDSRLELFYQYADANLDFARPVASTTTQRPCTAVATATFEQSLDERHYFVKAHQRLGYARYTRLNNLNGGGTRVISHNDCGASPTGACKPKAKPSCRAAM